MDGRGHTCVHVIAHTAIIIIHNIPLLQFLVVITPVLLWGAAAAFNVTRGKAQRKKAVHLVEQYYVYENLNRKKLFVQPTGCQCQNLTEEADTT